MFYSLIKLFTKISFLFLIALMLNSCGDKDQTHSTESSASTPPLVDPTTDDESQSPEIPPSSVNPTTGDDREVLINKEDENRIHFLLNLMEIYLDNKDSKLESGKEKETKGLIQEMQTANQKKDKNYLCLRLKNLRKYKGQFVFEVVNWKQSNIEKYVNSDQDLWILERDVLENLVHVSFILQGGFSFNRDPFFSIDEKEEIQKTIDEFKFLVENYSEANFKALDKYNLSDDEIKKESNHHKIMHLYSLRNLYRSIHKFKQIIEEKYLKLHSSPITEREMAFYFKTIFGNGYYDEFFEDLKKVISLAFEGKKASFHVKPGPDHKEVDDIMKKYDLDPKPFTFSIRQFTINQKQKWFDDMINELGTLLK